MKVDRLISIVLVLLDKNRISAQELADMFEVSLRTIYRDIDAIELAGIPIRELVVDLRSCQIIRLIKRYFQLLIFPLF